MAAQEKNIRPSLREELSPSVPLTLDGSFLLHRMFRVRQAAWKKQSAAARKRVLKEAITLFAEMEQAGPEGSALFSLVGHKGDLMVVHFRRTVDAVNDAELRVGNLDLYDFVEPTGSYLSVVELGLYEASVRLYAGLREKGLEPDSPEWNQAIEAELAKQRTAASPRLWPEIPPRRYLSFYPMNKKRGEAKNWYEVPITDRQRMMRAHGMIGRRYAGQVTQIISGSIGLDDWEWGVDLFADDPLVFKKLIYEMRFDEASAAYGEFGAFYLGLRFPAAALGDLLDGRAPGFS